MTTFAELSRDCLGNLPSEDTLRWLLRKYTIQAGCVQRVVCVPRILSIKDHLEACVCPEPHPGSLPLLCLPVGLAWGLQSHITSHCWGWVAILWYPIIAVSTQYEAVSRGGIVSSGLDGEFPFRYLEGLCSFVEDRVSRCSSGYPETCL